VVPVAPVAEDDPVPLPDPVPDELLDELLDVLEPLEAPDVVELVELVEVAPAVVWPVAELVEPAVPVPEDEDEGAPVPVPAPVPAPELEEVVFPLAWSLSPAPPGLAEAGLPPVGLGLSFSGVTVEAGVVVCVGELEDSADVPALVGDTVDGGTGMLSAGAICA
jgi:hypothetical protein